MEPRIYIYKVTFEEIPDWYWGAHKEKKYGEPYLGSPDTHAWKWEFYTPCLETLEFFPYTDEGWLESLRVEKRCIRPDLNNPLCLNENCGGELSLEANRKGGKVGGKIGGKIGGKKSRTTEENYVKAAQKGGESVHANKDEYGRSVHAVELGDRLHKKKNEDGKSINALKGAEEVHKEKDEYGRSIHARNCGQATMKTIELTNIETGEIFVFESRRLACRALGLNPGNVLSVCNGRKRQTGGYTARYLT